MFVHLMALIFGDCECWIRAPYSWWLNTLSWPVVQRVNSWLWTISSHSGSLNQAAVVTDFLEGYYNAVIFSISLQDLQRREGQIVIAWLHPTPPPNTNTDLRQISYGSSLSMIIFTLPFHRLFHELCLLIVWGRFFMELFLHALSSVAEPIIVLLQTLVVSSFLCVSC